MGIIAVAMLAALLAPAAAGPGGQPLTGEWVGGTNALGSWRMVQLRFAPGATTSEYSGSLDLASADVMRLPLADIRLDGEETRFRVPSAYGVYTFRGRLERDRLTGELTAPSGARSPLHVLRSRAEPAEDSVALAGAYRLPRGRLLLVTPRPFGQFAAAVVQEARGGLRVERTLVLVPLAPDRFVTSGSLIQVLKADETLEFVGDGSGGVKAALWRAPGEREIEAPRLRDEVDQEAVRFKSGPLLLDGTIWLPGGRGPFPAMALVQGSGPATRDSLFLRAREFARRGFIALTFDKRGTGRGDVRWEHASFEELAQDALAAVDYLRHHPRVDAARVGLQGNSQAGWIIPIAAARSPAVSFAIVGSGGGVPPADQEIYRARTQTQRRGFPAAEAEAAAAFMERKRDYAFTGTGWEAYEAAARQAASKAWFDFVNGPLVPDEEYWRDWRGYRGYDPRAFIAKMKQPVLVLLGAEDDTLPAAQAARIWEETLRSSGHSDFTVRVVSGLGHGLFSRETPDGTELRDDVFQQLVDWLAPRVGRATEGAPAPGAR